MGEDDTNTTYVISVVTNFASHLVAKVKTSASGATWWPNLEPKKVAPPGGHFLRFDLLQVLIVLYFCLSQRCIVLALVLTLR